ncbi:MAG: hypothetical protein EON58_22715 [Alphaproteobacteria bacterium]|nr:MAG: hypothetical protein EON58_22715 [Alphaproteobacteria bacterium]
MAIYSSEGADVPLHTEVFSETAMGAKIVDGIHLPAWRIAVDHSSNPRTMTLSIHHALYDAESLQVLLGDLALALQGKELLIADSAAS